MGAIRRYTPDTPPATATDVRSLVAWSLEEAERQPVLMVWEDLPGPTPSTLELLGLFIDQAPTAPLLPPADLSSGIRAAWPTRSHMTPLTLQRLEAPPGRGHDCTASEW